MTLLEPLVVVAMTHCVTKVVKPLQTMTCDHVVEQDLTCRRGPSSSWTRRSSSVAGALRVRVWVPCDQLSKHAEVVSSWFDPDDSRSWERRPGPQLRSCEIHRDPTLSLPAARDAL